MRCVKKHNPGKFINHGSHIPVLRSLARHVDIKTAIEFGCGLFSTLTLLDEKYFPNLMSLHSYETKSGWADRLKKIVGENERWTLTRIGKKVSDLKVLKLQPIDLLFVDGEDAQRVYIVKHFRKFAKIMVVHDVHQKRMRKYTRGQFVYRPPVPKGWTTIISSVMLTKKIKWNVKWEKDFYKWKRLYMEKK